MLFSDSVLATPLGEIKGMLLNVNDPAASLAAESYIMGLGQGALSLNGFANALNNKNVMCIPRNLYPIMDGNFFVSIFKKMIDKNIYKDTDDASAIFIAELIKTFPCR